MDTNRIWHLTNPTGNYIAQVCQNETSQAEAVIGYIKEGLLNDESIVVLARPALRKAVISGIDALGFDMQTIRNQGQIKFFDAQFLLSSLLIDGVLEEQVFQEYVGIPLQTLHLRYGKVRVFGGMVDILWKEGQHSTVMQLEDLWNDLSQKQEFSLLCSYSLDDLDPDVYDESFESICKCHNRLIPVENYDLSETGVGEAVLDVFGAAWNRVVGKLAESKKISAQMPQTTLLN